MDSGLDSASLILHRVIFDYRWWLVWWVDCLV